MNPVTLASRMSLLPSVLVSFFMGGIVNDDSNGAKGFVRALTKYGKFLRDV